MAQYPRAVAYLKEISKDKKLTEVYDLELLEEVLEHKSLEEYLSFKADILLYAEGRLREFTCLYLDWLDNSISEKDINVYKEKFEEGQHIRYFRDYFKDTKEEVSHNTKGTLIELKAYGTSQKINREVIVFEGRFYDDLLSSFTDKTDHGDEYISIMHDEEYDDDILPNDINLLKLLLENDCIDVLDPTLINDIIKDSLSEIENKINKLESTVKNERFTYYEKTKQFLIRSYNYTQEDNAKKLTAYSDGYLLDDVLADLKTTISQNYVFGALFPDNSWTGPMKKTLRSFCKKDYDNLLLQRLEQIRKTAVERIDLAISEQKRKKRAKFVKFLVWTGIIAGLLFWTRSRNVADKAEPSQSQAISDSSHNKSTGTGNMASSVKTPGKYFVSEEAIEGLALYKDVKKKKKLSFRLRPMDAISIEKVEDSMGFFESFMDDNYNTIPKGWVEMKRLVPGEGFYTYEIGESYRVKSDQEKVTVYKDCLKKNKFKTVLGAMDRINVYKIRGDLAFFKDFFSGGTTIDGWVELERIEKSR